MATEKPRFSLTLDNDTFDKLVSYKERHGFSTKSRAIQALVSAGLDDFEKSSVKTEKAPSMSDEAKMLLPIFEQLDKKDKYRVIGQVEGLLMHEKYEQVGSENAG